MTVNRDIRAMIRLAEDESCDVEVTRKHVKFYRDGKLICVSPTTPATNNRSIENTKSNLRKAGVPIPHKGGQKPKRRERGGLSVGGVSGTSTNDESPITPPTPNGRR